jgi:hypothetical protein
MLGNTTKEFISCCDAPFPCPPISSMDLQDATKGIGTQRRWHISHLNLQEVDFQMPNISIEKFPTFFGNVLEDAE